MIAFAVNSAGDCVAGTYGVKVFASDEAVVRVRGRMGHGPDPIPKATDAKGANDAERGESGRGAAALEPPVAVAYNRCNDCENKEQAEGSAEQVSELTTNRLSIYLRCLTELEGAGVETVSSQGLAEQFHLNAAQIRKDLAYFGEFGVRGVGYYVKDLRRHLRQILGLDRRLRVAIMGAGNLGLALADYPGFRQEGFEIVALFDVLNEKVGHLSKGGVAIHDIRQLKRIVRQEHISIAVVAVPASAAQHVVNLVVGAGVKAVLNFSPGTLTVPPDVKLKSVDLTVSLESLSFFLAEERAIMSKRELADPRGRGRTPADGRRRRQAGHRARGGRGGVHCGQRLGAPPRPCGQVKKGNAVEAARLAGHHGGQAHGGNHPALPHARAHPRLGGHRAAARRVRHPGHRPHERADRRRDGGVDGGERRRADALRHAQSRRQGDGHW